MEKGKHEKELYEDKKTPTIEDLEEARKKDLLEMNKETRFSFKEPLRVMLDLKHPTIGTKGWVIAIANIRDETEIKEILLKKFKNYLDEAFE